MNRFFVLLILVLVAGASQGLILPLLSLLLEKQGVAASVNSLSAAALYVGALLAVFFVEKPLVRYGYKPLLVVGLVMVVSSTVLFAIIGYSFVIWLILRFLVGVGDSILHYATQTWIADRSPENKRGRYMSLYGLMYSLGFSIGPLGINLLAYGTWVPFIVMGSLFGMTGLLLYTIRNERPRARKGGSSSKTYGRVYVLVWLPLLAPFLYGLMEAALNVSFPIYAAELHISNGWISLILPSFVLGSLLLQVPLGMLSDRFGPRPILRICAVIGGLVFFIVPFVGDHVYGLIILFALAGIFVGSFFGLGLAYVAMLLPRTLLASGNVLASLHFDSGSLVGPGLGGLAMEAFGGASLFYMLGSFLFLFALAGVFFRHRAF